MMVIKQVAEHIIVMNDSLMVVKDIPNAKFKVVGDTLVITQNGEKAMELPKSTTGILYK